MKKKIHYCWFGGKKLPKSVRECIATWKKMLPEYEIKEWNESNFDINTSNFVKEAYENKKWAFVSDYVRIYALYQEGGIYFDTDMKVLKNVSDIVDKDMFLGYEDSGFIGTAVIGVKEKNNKYIKEILDYYNKIDHFNPDIMYNYANPVIITKILKKYNSIVNEEGIKIFDNNIFVYPRDYFYPLSYNYAEREYTENTCMVHLFNATWTSKGERRTIGVYRKFGPDVGRFINNTIDKICNIKYRVIGRGKRIVNWAKMKYSIYINRAKRINKIKEELKRKKSDYIVICHPEYSEENKLIKTLENENIIYIREQYTSKEAKKIAMVINEANIKSIIFNSYANGWDKIIQSLKQINRKIRIKAIIHGENNILSDDVNFEKINEIINLYDKGKVNEIGFDDEDTFRFYKEKGYEAKLIYPYIDINKNVKFEGKNEKEYFKIGMYMENSNSYQNIFNQLAAVSLFENAKLDCKFTTYQMSTIIRKYSINMVGNRDNPNEEELYTRMAENDANIYVTLMNNGSTVPLESFELGVPCIISNCCKYFRNSDLEEEIIVKNRNDIYEIYKKMKYVIENKEKIIELYKKWKEGYYLEAKNKNIEFFN